MFYFQSMRITQDILYSSFRGLQLCFVHCCFGKHQLPVDPLQFLVKGKRTINLQCFLLCGLLVNKPDQVVLGKRFGHRHIGF